MLLVRLMRDRPTPRRPGDPVPVLVSLASWRPAEQDLTPWLIEQLPLTYPILEKPAPPDTGKRNRAEALLANHLLIPVLDGLDELPKSVHGHAFHKISNWLRPGAGLVVSCRTEHYLACDEDAYTILSRDWKFVTTGGLFCATARRLNWANAIYGGHGSDTSGRCPHPVLPSTRRA